MTDRRLWQTVAAVAREWPTGHVERLAARVEARGRQATARSGSALEQALFESWTTSSVSPEGLAAGLRAALVATEELRGQESVDLVWTGPFTEDVPLRRTETVLVEVIRAAERTLQLVSFVAYDVPSVAAALRDAVARGVQVAIVLEAPAALGGRLDTDGVAAMRRAVPGAAVYVWNGEETPGPQGVIHAKCAVADGRVALVTSANLTGAAMWRNMELGLLVRGGRQPARLARHLRALMDRRILTAVQIGDVSVS